jgi:hypothetical protein
MANNHYQPCELQGRAMDILMLSKSMIVYSGATASNNTDDVYISIFGLIKELIEPIQDYLANYAQDTVS